MPLIAGGIVLATAIATPQSPAPSPVLPSADYRTFIAYDPNVRVGVVVLSNAGNGCRAGRLWISSTEPAEAAPRHEFAIRLVTPPKQRMEVAVDPRLFDRYVGRYQLTPAVLIVTRDGTQLFVQLTGQPAFEAFSEGERDYFVKLVDARLTVELDAPDKATVFVLHQNGRDLRATRIE